MAEAFGNDIGKDEIPEEELQKQRKCYGNSLRRWRRLKRAIRDGKVRRTPIASPDNERYYKRRPGDRESPA